VGIGLVGLGYLSSPATMYGLYGITIDSVNEASMVRSAYGGLFLGFAILFFQGARREHFTKAALTALLVFMGSFALGRIISIVADGVPSLLILALLGAEIVYTALAFKLLSK